MSIFIHSSSFNPGLDQAGPGSVLGYLIRLSQLIRDRSSLQPIIAQHDWQVQPYVFPSVIGWNASAVHPKILILQSGSDWRNSNGSSSHEFHESIRESSSSIKV